jgi:hypothetical protein
MSAAWTCRARVGGGGQPSTVPRDAVLASATGVDGGRPPKGRRSAAGQAVTEGERG